MLRTPSQPPQVCWPQFCVKTSLNFSSNSLLAAVCFTAADSCWVWFPLLIILLRPLCLWGQLVQSQNDYGVTYTSTQICAVKGSTVVIGCWFKYPSRVNVLKRVWFTKGNDNNPEDLKTDPVYAGRVSYSPQRKSCTLTIRDLRESNSAVYKFRFETDQKHFTGLPGVTLTVTALQVHVDTSSYPDWGTLTCQSSCQLHDRTSYIWYKNGQKISTQSDQNWYSDYLNPSDSYSCAVRGHEASTSPSVCINGERCNRVNYSNRRICAFKGSSVDISSTYNSYESSIQSTSWFRSGRGSEDLREDSQYAGRVEVIETERGRSTLRIRDLTESDSAQYHFKFKTQRFEWKSSLPGTTLTVTVLQVKVSRIISVHESQTEAELKCESSCSPAGRLSFVWFKNGQKDMTQQTSTYTDCFYPGDNISCAFTGYEDYRSPPVYPPKLPSVSVSPSAEIVEGRSVTLTCSGDANPAANYTWYKEDEPLPVGPEGVHHFTSISSEDRGNYFCKSENQYGQINSSPVFINVQYAPKLPSVSVSPSAEIVEGSSVTLTCSSDANPAANYTWYKEDEDSPKTSGHNFTISNIRPEHSGRYYCVAQNSRGTRNSTLQLTFVTRKSEIIIMNIIRLTLVVLMLIPLLVLSLWTRRKKRIILKTEPNEPVEMTEMNSNQSLQSMAGVFKINWIKAFLSKPDSISPKMFSKRWEGWIFS
ncbi:KRAB domain-containing zinc finger protein [Sarotherodon galilaeus]